MNNPSFDQYIHIGVCVCPVPYKYSSTSYTNEVNNLPLISHLDDVREFTCYIHTAFNSFNKICASRSSRLWCTTCISNKKPKIILASTTGSRILCELCVWPTSYTHTQHIHKYPLPDDTAVFIHLHLHSRFTPPLPPRTFLVEPKIFAPVIHSIIQYGSVKNP